MAQEHKAKCEPDDRADIRHAILFPRLRHQPFKCFGSGFPRRLQLTLALGGFCDYSPMQLCIAIRAKTKAQQSTPHILSAHWNERAAEAASTAICLGRDPRLLGRVRRDTPWHEAEAMSPPTIREPRRSPNQSVEQTATSAFCLRFESSARSAASFTSRSRAAAHFWRSAASAI